MAETNAAATATAANKNVVKFFIAVKNPRISTPEANMLFEDAENASLDNKGARVWFKGGTKATGFSPKVYSKDVDSEQFWIASVRAKEHKEVRPDETYGEISTIEDLEALISSGYIARIVGSYGEGINQALVLEVEGREKKEEDKKALKTMWETTTKEVLESDILSKEELDERIKYLEEQGIKSGSALGGLYLKAIKKQNGGNIPKPTTTFRHLGGKKDENLISSILTHILCGNNVILQGAKSVGKNVAWETIAWLLNCRIVMLQCNGNMTKAEMFGHQTTDNSSKDAITVSAVGDILAGLQSKSFSDNALNAIRSVFLSMSPSLKMENGPITEALLSANEGNGTLLLADEMNLSDPNTLSGAFNALTDGHTRSVFVTGVGEIPINRECLIVGATQNSCGGDYLGTQQQNDATMSRFVCIDIQASPTIEPVLRATGIEVDEEIFTALNKCYKDFFDLVSRDEVSESVLNLRGLISALRAISLGKPFVSAVKECVVNTTPNKDEWDILDTIVSKNDPKDF